MTQHESLRNTGTEVYTLCPGLIIEFNYFDDVRVPELTQDYSEHPWDFRIDHCRLGRLETQLSHSGNIIYLPEGYFAINDGTNLLTNVNFPQEVYQGVTIVVRMEDMEDTCLYVLSRMGIDPHAITERYTNNEDGLFFAKDTGMVGELLNELYEIETKHDPSYLYIKVLEILHILGAEDKEESSTLLQFDLDTIRTLRTMVDKVLSGTSESEISLPRLIRESGMSTGEFYELFDQIYGQTPGRFLREHSLRTACQLLADGDIPVKEVAVRTGYNSSSKFSTTFKRRFGISPKDYRKAKLREAAGEDLGL